jgi:hypothetical protein
MFDRSTISQNKVNTERTSSETESSVPDTRMSTGSKVSSRDQRSNGSRFYRWLPWRFRKRTTHSDQWQQILDHEFQSLDIDADGYVSVADLQSVLRYVRVSIAGERWRTATDTKVTSAHLVR